MSSWMNSQGHRENMLKPEAQHLGVGYANNFWTQKFARPA
ncbi:MAG: CAP domain-containing protein [Chamaesiphon sp.]|nr:CAP domain-containing protein [Chamaesiphon sp.]